mmetsp:Transcript_28552/g.60543  ORF Transcript_28552/g.60543 Transcript_28552/m.60543 type:complete len:245 (+) Transcript_28552:190-924(+)
MPRSSPRHAIEHIPHTAPTDIVRYKFIVDDFSASSSNGGVNVFIPRFPLIFFAEFSLQQFSPKFPGIVFIISRYFWRIRRPINEDAHSPRFHHIEPGFDSSNGTGKLLQSESGKNDVMRTGRRVHGVAHLGCYASSVHSVVHSALRLESLPGNVDHAGREVAPYHPGRRRRRRAKDLRDGHQFVAGAATQNQCPRWRGIIAGRASRHALIHGDPEGVQGISGPRRKAGHEDPLVLVGYHRPALG